MTTRIDDDRVYQQAVAILTAQLGQRFMLGERLGGQGLGARAVMAADGTHGVLKLSDERYGPLVEAAVRLVEQIRAAGYPAPRPLHHGPMPGGYFYLQERAPGRPLREGGVYTELDADELKLLLTLLDQQAALAPAAPRDWSQVVKAVVLQQQHEWSLVAQSPLPVVQQLLKRCEQRVAGLINPTMRQGDLVIGDFGPHNILVDGKGQVTAVIDLEGAGRGDRIIDMVGLLYMVQPHLLAVVRKTALQWATPDAVAVCGIYWIIRRLHSGLRAAPDTLRVAAAQMLTHFDCLVG